MNVVEVTEGDGPIVLGMPHTGVQLPDSVFDKLNSRGQALSDTDWHIHRLYKGLLPDATTVRATFHRYVIDANRDPSGASLYPGQNTTGLVPTTDFDGHEIWTQEPTEGEIEDRREKFHAPYHVELAHALERTRDKYGFAILFDCHSIRSVIPFLFEGTLPDFNIGTNLESTCAPKITEAVANVCQAADGFTTILNGRFKGGWTTRHYGRPQVGLHAIQMELAQSTYMHEASPWTYLPERAGQTRKHLKQFLSDLHTLALKGELV